MSKRKKWNRDVPCWDCDEAPCVCEEKDKKHHKKSRRDYLPDDYFDDDNEDTNSNAKYW